MVRFYYFSNPRYQCDDYCEDQEWKVYFTSVYIRQESTCSTRESYYSAFGTCWQTVITKGKVLLITNLTNIRVSFSAEIASSLTALTLLSIQV